MGMDYFEQIIGFKRKLSADKLIQDNAQGVKISAVIQDAVHPSCLLRRNIGQCTFKHIRIFYSRFFSGQGARNPEVNDLQLPCFMINNDIGRIDILMNYICSMYPSQSIHYLYGDGKRFFQGKP